MPLIDSEGLFNGDRMRLLSREAWVLFPFFMLASNGYARLEISYRKLMGKAFACLPDPPTEQQFWDLIEEYNNAYLMFVYQVNGAYWGQWDTSVKLLPRFKTRSDEESPAPPPAEWMKWKTEYIEVKSAKNASKPSAVSKFVNASEVIQERFGVVRRVVGVVVGVGGGVVVGKTICPSGDGRANSEIPKDPKNPALFEELEPRQTTAKDLLRQQAGWFGEWWSIYWLKVARKPAFEAFKKHVKTSQRFEAVMAATKSQLPEMEARDPHKRPHGASWLNAERWDDEIIQSAGGSVQVQGMDERARMIEERMRQGGIPAA